MRAVEVRLAEAETAAISEGAVAAGETVVIDGVDKLQDGRKVAPVRPARAAASGKARS